MEKRRVRRIAAAAMSGFLTLSLVIPVHADSISDAQQKGQQLEQQKNTAENEKNSLSAQLNQVVSDMEDAEKKLTAKQDEIKTAQDELVKAQIQENDQYEAMKLRIKYMYENGNTSLIEVLFSAKSMGDLLNKAEYVKTISEYDREMLEKYENLTKEVEKKEKALQKEEEELKTLQNDLIQKKDNVNKLLQEKQVEIASLETQIGENAAKLQQLIKEAQEAKRRQEEAAAAKKAAEEAAKDKQQSQNKPSNGGGSANSGNSGSSGSGGSGGGGSHVSGNGTLSYPVANPRITSGFGYREAPTEGATSRHDGVDFGAATGTPIYASADGTVVTSAYNSARGNYVVINHGNGMQTWYQHCSAVYVTQGQKVSRGQNIAAVGATGIVTGPHLHYEVHVNGVPVDPMNYL